MPATSLVILASNGLYREGLGALLGAETDVCVTATAGDWPQALALVREHRPEVLLVDLDTTGVAAGIQALRRIRYAPAVVALGADGDADAAVAWAEMGLAGWVSRGGTANDVLRVVRDAGRGELQCTARATAAMARRLAEVAATKGAATGARRRDMVLTSREREILALMEQGLTNREIAEHLTIALPTVKNHVHHILDKLGARGRLEAVMATRGV